jgi:oxygen-independent coproporphyrinogen-3 oxidase
MPGTSQLDPELIRRYEQDGPRYTSYPTAPHFHDGFGASEFREFAERSNDAPSPDPLSLYIHIPFCYSPCFYCGCNRVVTWDLSRGGPYLERLFREIEMVSPLFDRGREVVQVHLGGGTPNFLATAGLNDLMNCLAGQFSFSDRDDRDFSIELDPRHIDADGIAALADTGFNRASLGVQDFDPEVQAAINREQSVEETMAVIEACRATSFRSVNVDLIYGLPRQTLEGFRKTVATIIDAKPERLAIYGYAHLPQMFKAQRQIREDELPNAELRLSLLATAAEMLEAAGYRYIGLDHFALPGDDLSVAQENGGLHRNFMGYTTHAECDLIGFGVSAISHVNGSFSQNHRDLKNWQNAVDEGRLPVWRGLALGADDRIRGFVIQSLMCQARVEIDLVEQRFGIEFARYFAETLKALVPLADDGLLLADDQAITVSPRGRYLLRIIAMCFDAYRQSTTDSRPTYSKAI